MDPLLPKQVRYQAALHSDDWWKLQGSNLRHSPCKGDALPAELNFRLVAGPGIAPGTRAYETLEILLLHPAIDGGNG